MCNIEQFLEKESGCLKDPAALCRAYFLIIVLGNIVISASQTHAGHYYFIII